MMKKFLFTILLFFACAAGYAQSLSFEELLNVTNMTDTQVHDFLTASKGFKQDGVQNVNGKSYTQYKIMRSTPDKMETVLLGITAKGASGNPSREVLYSTMQESDISSLLTQAKKSTFSLVFQGADHDKQIYRFDNSLFRATISLGFDKKSGGVQVEQKE